MAENIVISGESEPTVLLYAPEQEPASPRKFQGSSTTRSSSSEDSDDLLFNVQAILATDKFIRSLHQKDVLTCLTQNCSRLSPGFLNNGSINSKMRTRLVKWMGNLVSDLEFKNDTLFLSISILDHYLAAQSETLQRLQLIGAASIYISSKLLQTKLVSPQVYSYSASGVFDEQDLLSAEKKILLALNFKTDFPDALRFLKLIRGYEKLTEKEFSQSVQILLFLSQNQNKYYEYSGLELAELTAKLIKTTPNITSDQLTYKVLEKGFRHFKL